MIRKILSHIFNRNQPTASDPIAMRDSCMIASDWEPTIGYSANDAVKQSQISAQCDAEQAGASAAANNREAMSLFVNTSVAQENTINEYGWHWVFFLKWFLRLVA